MKKALVISGGGSKGAFAVGVVRELKTQFPNLEFDTFVGTSTGALIAPYVALGELDLVEEIYTTTETRDVIIRHNIGTRLNKRSVFSATPLKNLISRNLPNPKAGILLNHSPKEVILTTACLQTGELAVFTSGDPINGNDVDYDVFPLIDGDHYRRAMLASACQPVFMNPIKVNKKNPNAAHEDFQYVDGGVVEYAGIQMAVDAGADEIFAILLSPQVKLPDLKEYNSLFAILQRSISVLSEDVAKNDVYIPQLYNEGLEYVDAVKRKMKRNGVTDADIDEYFSIKGRPSPFANRKPIKFHIIRPTFALNGGPGGLTFDPVTMADMVNIGRESGVEFIAAVPNHVKDDWA